MTLASRCAEQPVARQNRPRPDDERPSVTGSGRQPAARDWLVKSSRPSVAVRCLTEVCPPCSPVIGRWPAAAGQCRGSRSPCRRATIFGWRTCGQPHGGVTLAECKQPSIQCRYLLEWFRGVKYRPSRRTDACAGRSSIEPGHGPGAWQPWQRRGVSLPQVIDVFQPQPGVGAIHLPVAA